jgi:hypothetical protein
VKYKLIDAMAHNWTHSFMSGMNYVDGQYVYSDMHQLARARHGEKVVVTWMPEWPEELAALTPRIRLVVDSYREGLPDHLVRHGIEPGAIAECVRRSTSTRAIACKCVRTCWTTAAPSTSGSS